MAGGKAVEMLVLMLRQENVVEPSFAGVSQEKKEEE